MKQDYTMYVYKKDKRTKSGERLVSTAVYCGRDDKGMSREVTELSSFYNPKDGYRFEFHPLMKKVRNLMSGVEIEIPYDTPRACDPSSELYWSM